MKRNVHRVALATFLGVLASAALFWLLRVGCWELEHWLGRSMHSVATSGMVWRRVSMNPPTLFGSGGPPRTPLQQVAHDVWWLCSNEWEWGWLTHTYLEWLFLPCGGFLTALLVARGMLLALPESQRPRSRRIVLYSLPWVCATFYLWDLDCGWLHHPVYLLSHWSSLGLNQQPPLTWLPLAALVLLSWPLAWALYVEDRLQKWRGPLPDTAAYPVIRLLGRMIFKPLYRLRSHGEDRVPAEGPVILAANHSSYWDPVFLQLSVPGRQVRWLMDEDYYNLPVLRWFFRAVGCIPVKNAGGNRRALEAAVEVLKAGGVLGIFPEGRISRTGRMIQAHTGVSLLSARTGAPVVPAYLRGAMFSWPKGQKLPLLSRVEVRFAAPMRLAEGEGTEKAALRAFADRLMAEIKGLFGRGGVRVGPREGE